MKLGAAVYWIVSSDDKSRSDCSDENDSEVEYGFRCYCYIENIQVDINDEDDVEEICAKRATWCYTTPGLYQWTSGSWFRRKNSITTMFISNILIIPVHKHVFGRRSSL